MSPHRPLFSHAAETVAERIARIKPKVDPMFLRDKTEFEKMMLEGRDIMFQQNETLADAADEIVDTLKDVKSQSTITNGRVTKAEVEIRNHGDFIDGWKKSAAKRTKIMTTLIPVFVVGLEIVAHKLGWL